jgi:8-amino-7-oxononanoate synthase
VPRGTSRLRIALRATHREADIDALLAAIGAAL